MEESENLKDVKFDISLEEAMAAREAGRIKSRELAADPDVQQEAARIGKRRQEKSGLIPVDRDAQASLAAFRARHGKRN
jgi:hypothetical protein